MGRGTFSQLLRFCRIAFAATPLLILGLLTSACSLDASITNTAIAPSLVISSSRTEPDFLHGEMVTTSSGYRLKTVFNEIGDKQALPNGYKVEGVFYER